MIELSVKTRVTRYEVCALPEDWPHFDVYYDQFVIVVAQLQDGRWSVQHRGRYLHPGGSWYLTAPHGYTLEEALRFARVHATRVQSMHMTAVEFMPWAETKLEAGRG